MTRPEHPVGMPLQLHSIADTVVIWTIDFVLDLRLSNFGLILSSWHVL